MGVTQIDFNSFTKTGDIIAENKSDGLFLSVNKQNTKFHAFNQPLTSYITLPKQVSLPLKVDFTLNMPIPGFYLLVNKGRVSFGTRMDNRSLGDIAEPDCSKPKSFDNRADLTKDNDITVIYGLKFMQIIINGETRYFSKKEKYMRSELLSEANKTSFEIKIAADKFADITVKKMNVEEYEYDPEPIPICNEILPARLSLSKAKASFEECISLLSPTLQKEIVKTDRLLIAAKELKIKRKIEGDQFGCKVTYKSAHGFSYSLCINENLMNHFFWWYMLSNYKFDGKYGGRKNDLTIETLKRVYNQSPEIASRLFGYYDECYRCEKGCRMPTIYEFQGEKTVTCHGKMFMNMNPQTFSDLRVMFDVMKTVIKEFENGF